MTQIQSRSANLENLLPCLFKLHAEIKEAIAHPHTDNSESAHAMPRPRTSGKFPAQHQAVLIFASSHARQSGDTDSILELICIWAARSQTSFPKWAGPAKARNSPDIL